METDQPKKSGSPFIPALVCFTVAVAISILLLLAALVVWLSELTGSFIAASLIIAVFFAVLAVVIYLLSVRDGIRRISRRVDTVYEVADTAREGCRWAANKFLLLLQLLGHGDEETRKEGQ